MGRRSISAMGLPWRLARQLGWVTARRLTAAPSVVYSKQVQVRNTLGEVGQMNRALHGSLVGHLELEAHLRPLSCAGQFRMGTLSANDAKHHTRRENTLLMIGVLLVLPGLLALLFGWLKYNLGLPTMYDTAFSSAIFVTLATASLFLGTPLALVLNLFPILRLSFTRQPDGVTTAVTVEPTLWQVLILGVAFLIAAAFFGHLVADAFACFRGLKSAC